MWGKQNQSKGRDRVVSTWRRTCVRCGLGFSRMGLQFFLYSPVASSAYSRHDTYHRCFEWVSTEAHLHGDMIVFRFPSEKTGNQDLGDAGTRAARKASRLSLGHCPSLHLSSDYSQSVSLSEFQILEREDLIELLVKC